ncbi:MAG: hypothetical protein WCK42_04220 [Myxococcaceae bacterium]
MGFFGLFGKNTPTEKQIAKQVNHLKEQYAKPEYRQMAMDKLFEWGTRECLIALLNRFKVVVQSPHWDEQEKRWLVDEMVKRGDASKDVLREFVMNENEVTYAISALSKLCLESELVDILKQALLARSPEDHRSSESKMELIAALEEYDLPDLATLLIPYLDDHHDDVKCITLDVLAKKQINSAYPKIISLLGEEFHSARVLRHTASKAYALGLELPEGQKLAPEIEEDFEIKSRKLVSRH